MYTALLETWSCSDIVDWNLLELGRTIMQGIALALGGPRDLFEGERAGDPFWILRVIGYPPVNNLSNVGDGHELIFYG
jgi:isopenicillin N synthase-like dioxygenase